MVESIIKLKKNKHKLTKQQFKTFKGQILSGDIKGFKKGFNKVLERNKNNVKK